jgi:hypothetical protein
LGKDLHPADETLDERAAIGPTRDFPDHRGIDAGPEVVYFMNPSSSINASIDPTHFAAPVARLLAEPRLNELGPGRPNLAVEAELRRLSPESLFAGQQVVDSQMATACLAGLWLYHDFLDESHRLSQDGDGASFSFWHGIMHRREPDYGNAKYWFRRVGNHPIYRGLLEEARALGRQHPAAESDAATRRLLEGRSWDAAGFVDRCEAASAGQPSIEPICRAIQWCEWRLLFDFCYRKATGEPLSNA